jgi:hypothetical protein
MHRTAMATLLVAALSFGAALPTRADSDTPLRVADYTVFVDPPTGFVFVKLPAGWKFVGSVSKEDVAHLPGGVVTALLPPDDQHMAANAKPAAPKRSR